LTGTPSNNGGVSIDVLASDKIIGSESGNGGTVTIPKGTTNSWVRIYISGGATCNNLLFKPMLTTDLNATYDDYVPYTGDSGRLNEDVSNKQDKTDNALVTSDKTIVGAINELNSDLSNKQDTSSALKYELALTSQTIQANETKIFNVSGISNTGTDVAFIVSTTNDFIVGTARRNTDTEARVTLHNFYEAPQTISTLSVTRLYK
jgi:hypothetical protein